MSGLRDLSIIDSSIGGLSKLLNAVGPRCLEQLLFIFNEDVDPVDEDYSLYT